MSGHIRALRLTLVAAQLGLLCYSATSLAEPGLPEETPHHPPRGECSLSLAQIVSLRGSTAVAAPKFNADTLMSYLKGRFGELNSEEGREAVLDGMGKQLQVDLRAGSNVQETVADQADRGTQTKAFVAGLNGLRADVDAVKMTSAPESWALSLARRTPVLGRMIANRKGSAEAGLDDIGRLRGRVDTLVGQGVELRSAYRRDQVDTEADLFELDRKIYMVERFREMLDAEVSQMPKAGPEWGFLSQVVGKLEDTEEKLRSQSIVLRKGSTRSAMVQRTISEGIATLRDVTSIHLLDLESSLSDEAGAASAEQMQELAADIKLKAQQASERVAERILAATKRTIEMQSAGALDPYGETKAGFNLDQARLAQEEFDRERASQRRGRLLQLKAAEQREKLIIEQAEEKRAIALGLEPAGSTTLALPPPSAR